MKTYPPSPHRLSHLLRLGASVGSIVLTLIQGVSLSASPGPRSPATEAVQPSEPRILAVYDLDRLLPRPDPEQERSASRKIEVDVLFQIGADGTAKSDHDRSVGRPARMIAELTRAMAQPADPTIECEPVGRTLVVRGTEAGQAAARSAIQGMQRVSREYAVRVTGEMIRYLPSVNEVLTQAGLPSVHSTTPGIGAAIVDSSIVESALLSRSDRISQTDVNMTSRGFETWVTAAENIYHYISDFAVHELIDGTTIAAPVVESITEGVKVEVITLACVDPASGKTRMLLDVRLHISKLLRPTATFTTNMQGLNENVTIHLPELTQTRSRATVLLEPGQTVVIGPGRIPSGERESQKDPGNPTIAVFDGKAAKPPIEEVLVVVITAELVDR